MGNTLWWNKINILRQREYYINNIYLGLASICHYLGRCWIGSLWKSTISSKKLWHDFCFQRLSSEGSDGKCCSYEYVGSCQGMVKVSDIII